MFDEQLAQITDFNKVTYSQMAKSLDRTLLMVEANELSHEDGTAAVLGILAATITLLLRKLEAQEGDGK